MTMTRMNPSNEVPGAALVASGDPAFRSALEPSNFDSAYRLAAMAASTGIGGVKTPEDALIRIMTGRALGLSAMQSLSLVYVVRGNPGLRSVLMVALCRVRPECEYFEMVESTEEFATYRTKRRGRPEVKLTWTVQQAERAGLLSGANGTTWTHYRAELLRSRCSSALARIEWPEAILNLYSVEELTSGIGPGSEVDGMAAVELVGESVQPAGSAAAPRNPGPTQAARRDFAAEADAIKQRIVDAKTKDELKAVRAEAAAFVADAGEPWATQLRNFYSVTMSKAPKVAPPPPPSSVSEVERPADAGDAWEGAA